MIGKGTISALLEGGKKVTIKPYLGEVVTPELVVPFFLFDCLTVGMPVVYAAFEDNSGVVLARMDGEWNHRVWDGIRLESGDFATHAVPEATTDTRTPAPTDRRARRSKEAGR